MLAVLAFMHHKHSAASIYAHFNMLHIWFELAPKWLLAPVGLDQLMTIL